MSNQAVNREVCKKCSHLRYEEIIGVKRYLFFFEKEVVAAKEYYCDLMPMGEDYCPMWITWSSGTDVHDMPPPDNCPYLLEHTIT